MERGENKAMGTKHSKKVLHEANFTRFFPHKTVAPSPQRSNHVLICWLLAAIEGHFACELRPKPLGFFSPKLPTNKNARTKKKD